MSVPNAGVLAQLAFLGLDNRELQDCSAQVEIDRFDQWTNPSGAMAVDWPCTMGITPARQAA